MSTALSSVMSQWKEQSSRSISSRASSYLHSQTAGHSGSQKPTNGVRRPPGGGGEFFKGGASRSTEARKNQGGVCA